VKLAKKMKIEGAFKNDSRSHQCDSSQKNGNDVQIVFHRDRAPADLYAANLKSEAMIPS